MDPNEMPPEFAELVDVICNDCVHLIADGTNYQSYIHYLSRLHKKYPPQMQVDFNWQAMFATARMVWLNTPHPALNYALPSVPKTGRNDLCPCGSGQKHKQCCLPSERALPPLDPINFLPHLLGFLPRKAWHDLAGSRVPVEMVIDTALQWSRAGLASESCLLLAPWFIEESSFHASHEVLLDLLIDAYDDVPHRRKKTQLLERAIKLGDARIRSAAMQRKATIVADQGDYSAAWKLFTQAQRSDPQSPSLSQLEVILLLNQGRINEARERARFWAHRLTAMRDPQLDGLIDFMRQVAEDGTEGMQKTFIDFDPSLRELVEMLASAPPLESLYTLDPFEGSAGPLQPNSKLQNALQAWDATAEKMLHHPLATGNAAGDTALWPPLLRKHPMLWNSFEMLGTMVMAICDRQVSMLDDAIARPLLERGVALLREVLRANHADNCKLEWGCMENRAALHLLGERILIDGDLFDDAQMALLEWLVNTLNPNDNQGFRDNLMRGLLSHGRINDALDLSARYPEDFPAMRYNRALALFAAERMDEACRTLESAAATSTKLLIWLLKKTAKAPKQNPLGIEVGGDEEAWYYRQSTLALWQKLDAMDWLRALSKAIKTK